MNNEEEYVEYENTWLDVFQGFLAAMLTPLLYMIIFYIVGLFIKITIGYHFTLGLTFIGICISEEQIPLFCAIIGFLKSIFKN